MLISVRRFKCHLTFRFQMSFNLVTVSSFQKKKKKKNKENLGLVETGMAPHNQPLLHR
ncbi:hypothetical protein HanIR_Chr04g0183891 [Helianthus annuus]|nr:hypothetical protein HanIR_Chr04g0183891 [Helianthus annuus]